MTSVTQLQMRRPSTTPNLEMVKAHNSLRQSSSVIRASKTDCIGRRPQGQPPSPLGPLVAFATGEGYNVKPNEHVPFHGYYFKMLNSQGSNAPGGAKDYLVNGKMAGGFAFVAYPSNYGNSGVMTFIINQDAVLLQKDLGKTTTQTAEAMTAFDPDKSWSVVTE